MLTSFTRRLARAISRRTAFVILGAALATTVVGIGLTSSRFTLLLALCVITAALAATVLDVRSSRIMLHDLRWRLGKTDERVAALARRPPYASQLKGRIAELETELSQMRSLLAIYLYEKSKSGDASANELLPAGLIPVTTLGLLDRGDALDAYALVSATKSFSSLSIRTLRRMRNELQRRGYLSRSLEVARAVEKISGEERDLLSRRHIQGNIAVLSGAFELKIRSDASSFESRPSRVLHLVGRSLPQDQVGYTIRTHYTAIAQKAGGLDPHVATQMGFAHGGDAYISEELDGVTYHRVPGPRRGEERFDHWLRTHVQRVANLVRVVRPAVLHPASDFVNALTARAVGAEYGIPVVYEARGFWEESWLSRKTQEFGWDIKRLENEYGLPDEYLWRREIENRMRLEADRVVTLADVMADRIEAGGVPRDQIAVVPNAVAVDDFPVLSRNHDLAASLGISDDTTVIGYISSLVEYEGIDTLLDAYAIVRESAPGSVALVIVGDGPVREPLIRQAKALGMDDATFTGRVDHDRVLDYYSLIDLFVVPRRPVEVCHLVTPLKPFEAFSTGRTVVLSNVRALAAIAEQSGAAELFEAGDALALAEVLLALLNDPVRQKALADAGAAWVRAERTWSANAQAYLKLYHDIGAVTTGSTKPPRALNATEDLVGIEELRSRYSGPKLLPGEAGVRPSEMNGQSLRAAEEARFRFHPFVCGAIGRWNPETMDRIRRAAPGQLRSVHSSETAVAWASSDIHRWQSGSQQGVYWSPMAAGSMPTSWTAAAQDLLAAGIAFDGHAVVLHTCALGLQELYVRELDGVLYFAVTIDPLLAADTGPLHPDPAAWASVLALGCPVGAATPFAEVRRAVAATGWRIQPGTQDRLTNVSFEPSWLGVESVTPSRVGDVVELIASQIPGPESRIALGLSGGRDSRLLAALASRRGAGVPTAWTVSTDDGLERDLWLAGPVADTLGLDHRLVVPGPEAWIEDREDVRVRLQYQTWYHTWMMPLARVIHRRSDVLLDGLGGGALFDGGMFVNETVRCEVNPTEKRLALLARLSNNRLADTGLLAPDAAAWVEESARSAFLAATDHLDGHREMPLLSVLATRTSRAIASSPMCLLGPEAEVRIPFMHPDVITAALQIPLEYRVGGYFYRELLEASCGPTVAALPTTKDHHQPGRRVARRQTSAAALAAMAAVIKEDQQIKALLGPELERSLSDPAECARIAQSNNARVTLQWAEMFASWRQRYSGRLVGSGGIFE